MTDTDPELYVDKCTECETYVVTASRTDLVRRMNAHELERHGQTYAIRTDQSDQ